MKGSEERDLLFGKLFGYIAIIRSGKLSEERNSVDIFMRILDLHFKRGWIREVTSETILLLLESNNFRILSNEIVFSKLQSLLSEISLSDMAPWQLMLALGLQFYGGIYSGEDISVAISSLLGPSKDIFTPENMNDLQPVLLASTAGFPKVYQSYIQNELIR